MSDRDWRARDTWREAVRRYRIEAARRLIDRYGLEMIDGNQRMKSGPYDGDDDVAT